MTRLLRAGHGALLVWLSLLHPAFAFLGLGALLEAQARISAGAGLLEALTPPPPLQRAVGPVFAALPWLALVWFFADRARAVCAIDPSACDSAVGRAVFVTAGVAVHLFVTVCAGGGVRRILIPWSRGAQRRDRAGERPSAPVPRRAHHRSASRRRRLWLRARFEIEERLPGGIRLATNGLVVLAMSTLGLAPGALLLTLGRGTAATHGVAALLGVPLLASALLVLPIMEIEYVRARHLSTFLDPVRAAARLSRAPFAFLLAYLVLYGSAMLALPLLVVDSVRVEARPLYAAILLAGTGGGRLLTAWAFRRANRRSIGPRPLAKPAVVGLFLILCLYALLLTLSQTVVARGGTLLFQNPALGLI